MFTSVYQLSRPVSFGARRTLAGTLSSRSGATRWSIATISPTGSRFCSRLSNQGAIWSNALEQHISGVTSGRFVAASERQDRLRKKLNMYPHRSATSRRRRSYPSRASAKASSFCPLRRRASAYSRRAMPRRSRYAEGHRVSRSAKISTLRFAGSSEAPLELFGAHISASTPSEWAQSAR